ncbi:hypothetical protein AAVH_43613 [Aphelenchoides avenae]|nr:hypothetical protein AAVH_43613 [Aphelenchus avenae]
MPRAAKYVDETLQEADPNVVHPFACEAERPISSGQLSEIVFEPPKEKSAEFSQLAALDVKPTAAPSPTDEPKQEVHAPNVPASFERPSRRRPRRCCPCKR